MQQVTAISYHDTVNDLQGLDWSADNPFARPEWFRLLEESGITPLLATARKDNEAITLPLRQRGAQLEAMTNWYAFTWSDLRTSGLEAGTMLEDLARDLSTANLSGRAFQTAGQ